MYSLVSAPVPCPAALELLTELAEDAILGRAGDVVILKAPQWPPLPACPRQEVDGRSVCTRPGTARYAPAAQLPVEETWSRRRRDGWPCAVLPEGPPGTAEN